MKTHVDGDIDMLLFSTLLKINKSVTKEQFIRLMLRWNEENPRKINVIPDITWNGETDIRHCACSGGRKQ